LPATEAAEIARKLYFTRGGYSHKQVDDAGEGILRALSKLATEYAEKFSSAERISISVGFSQLAIDPNASFGGRHRRMTSPNSSGERCLSISWNSQAPANGQIGRFYRVLVPIDAGADDELILKSDARQDLVEFRVSDVIPKMNTVAQLRLAMFFEGAFSLGMQELALKATESLKSRKLR
jgi:hypothetical protein